ncbi:unnamed protein product, partial [Nesidiocoris tenuis]
SSDIWIPNEEKKAQIWHATPIPEGDANLAATGELFRPPAAELSNCHDPSALRRTYLVHQVSILPSVVVKERYVIRFLIANDQPVQLVNHRCSLVTNVINGINVSELLDSPLNLLVGLLLAFLSFESLDFQMNIENETDRALKHEKVIGTDHADNFYHNTDNLCWTESLLREKIASTDIAGCITVEKLSNRLRGRYYENIFIGKLLFENNCLPTIWLDRIGVRGKLAVYKRRKKIPADPVLRNNPTQLTVGTRDEEHWTRLVLEVANAQFGITPRVGYAIANCSQYVFEDVTTLPTISALPAIRTRVFTKKSSRAETRVLSTSTSRTYVKLMKKTFPNFNNYIRLELRCPNKNSEKFPTGLSRIGTKIEQDFNVPKITKRCVISFPGTVVRLFLILFLNL